MPEHTIEPVYDDQSRILILGTFPSVKSRETNFFYGHKQNRFWKVLSILFEAPLPETIEEKKAFLLEHHIAVWDVIASCSIKGSSDASISDVVPNDLGPLLEAAPIGQIFTNGGKADALYQKYLEPQTHMKVVKLPSTSPANASYSLTRLLDSWQVVKDTAQSLDSSEEDE